MKCYNYPNGIRETGTSVAPPSRSVTMEVATVQLNSTVLSRFWAKVNKTDGCWLWTASTKNGYGQLSVPGGVAYAHHISYVIHHGPIPTGLYVCHTCDVQTCVNPAHLFAATQRENMRDMALKGRSSHGEGRPCHKLTESDIPIILQMRAEGNKLRDIGDRFGVGAATISAICLGRRWRITQETIWNS